MNREDIIRMAIEAGWDAHHAEFDTRIERFAALVASAEREACAKVVEAWSDWHGGTETLANAIRARGQA
jgi:hypothetical protein